MAKDSVLYIVPVKWLYHYSAVLMWEWWIMKFSCETDVHAEIFKKSSEAGRAMKFLVYIF